MAILMTLSGVLFSASKQDYGTAIASKVTSIYDADTFRVNIQGWPDIIGRRIPIRVRGVDAPEIRGKCESEKIAARAAKKYTVLSLRSAKTIELRNIQRGKYFRIIADVYIDGWSLSKALIKAGHGRKYSGGKRMGWCD